MPSRHCCLTQTGRAVSRLVMLFSETLSFSLPCDEVFHKLSKNKSDEPEKGDIPDFAHTVLTYVDR